MTPSVKRRTTRRLRIISGQVKGLSRMVEEEQYCIDVITQSLAIREALVSFEKLMLEHHLVTHVSDQVRSGKVKQAAKEILSIYNRLTS